jgi:hypothetical protein
MTKARAFRGFRFPTEVILWEERIQRESYVDHPVAGHDREEEMEP